MLGISLRMLIKEEYYHLRSMHTQRKTREQERIFERKQTNNW